MSDQPLRVALVATPRSGNSWLGYMLTQLFELNGIVFGDPQNLDWAALPERVFLNAHWRLDELMLSRLKEHGFRTIVLARHPLDVLISILVFSQHYHATAEWLDGSYGDERCLQGSCPMSEAFAAYAAGPRAGAAGNQRRLVADAGHDFPAVRRPGARHARPIGANYSGIERFAARIARRGACQGHAQRNARNVRALAVPRVAGTAGPVEAAVACARSAADLRIAAGRSQDRGLRLRSG